MYSIVLKTINADFLKMKLCRYPLTSPVDTLSFPWHTMGSLASVADVRYKTSQTFG